MNRIATFFTHHGALVFSRKLKGAAILHEMCPVPRSLSSSCGTGVRFGQEGQQLAVTSPDVDAVFQVTASGYDLLFRQEDTDQSE